ncbi:MAG: TonB family protein [Chitinophagaceae bacterium]
MHQFYKRFPHKIFTDYIRIYTINSQDIFSFGKYLFAPEGTPALIIQHELVHIKDKHTTDNIFLEFIRIFCWFNPALYLYQQAIRNIHEYIADEETAFKTGKEDYAKQLVQYAFHHSGTSIANSFFKSSQLKYRLIMLQKKNSSEKAGRKYLLLLPLVAVIVVISISSFTIKNKVSDMITSLSSVGQQLDIKGVVTDQYGNPVAKATVLIYGTQIGTITNTNGHFSLKNVPENGMLAISMIGYSTILLNVNSEKTLHLTLYSDPVHLSPLVVTGYALKTSRPVTKQTGGYPIAKQTEGYPVAFVEQMPSFPGGEDALVKYFSDHVKYPQEAHKEGLQGTVIVSFVVDKDGNLSDVHVINAEIGGGLEEEAVRLVKAMPKWIPGRQNGEAVAVPYTLPIRFVLQ